MLKYQNHQKLKGSHICNRWSDIANSLAFLISLSRQIRSSHVLRGSCKKMSKPFSVISKLAVTTRIAVDYSREDFFLEGIFESKKLPSLQMDVKTTLSLQNGIFFSIVHLRRALQSSEDLTLQGSRYTNCSLGTVKLTLFLTNDLFKKYLMHESMKFFGQPLTLDLFDQVLMFSFYQKYDQFSAFNKKRKKILYEL